MKTDREKLEEYLEASRKFSKKLRDLIDEDAQTRKISHGSPHSFYICALCNVINELGVEGNVDFSKERKSKDIVANDDK